MDTRFSMSAATWQRGPLRITLSGRNLFNQEYYFDAAANRPIRVLRVRCS